MLARTSRLTRSRDIIKVYHKGRFAGAPNLYVKALHTHAAASRAAIVVSKKISKKAVVRNRNRRRLSGVIEALWQTVRPGYDIVINVTADANSLPVDQLRSQLTTALTRAGVLEPTT